MTTFILQVLIYSFIYNYFVAIFPGKFGIAKPWNPRVFVSNVIADINRCFKQKQQSSTEVNNTNQEYAIIIDNLVKKNVEGECILLPSLIIAL